MRDELFEAMVTVCGWDYQTLTPSARGWINGALKELRPVCDDPKELLKRGRRYYLRYGYATPSAMVKHYPAFGDPTPVVITAENCEEHLFPEEPEDDRGRYCVRCREWIPVVVQLRLIEGDIA